MGRKRRTRKMNGTGSITKLKGNRNKPWLVRSPAELQIDGTKRRIVLGYYKTSEEAEIALAKFKINPFNIDDKNTTLNDLYEIWIEEKKKQVTKKRSWERYSKVYEAHLLHIKDKPIRNIMFSELQSILFSTVSGTSKHLKQMLNGIYGIALKNNIIDKDITQLLEISKEKAYSRKTYIFDRELIQKIRTFSNETDDKKYKKIADMTLILLYSGMRSGEIRTLEKKNIFLDKNYMIGGIKTKAGIDRVIPIHPKIKSLIEYYYKEYPSKDYLFSQERFNKPFSEVVFVYGFLELRQMLNFEHNRHSTRHTFITELKRLKITESKIKKIVGHSTSDVTDGVYTHYTPEDLFIEIKKVDYGDI